jgi:TonB-linked SusC/RagA family outer membrane protein
MALQGRMAGVDITPYTGVAGSAVKIQIRGQNSLRSDGNFPLYVIDGVQVDSRPLRSSGALLNYGFDPLSTINPSNIESIQVLKDADATAIYGSRGANGVIIITTKKGTASGPTNFTLSASSGIGQISNKVDLLNTEEYLEMRNEAFTNDGATPGALDVDLNGTWDNQRYTDWQEELLGGNSNVTDVQAGITGGSANTSFRFTGGFHKENVIIPGDFSFHSITSNLNLTHTSPNKKLTAILSINYGANKNTLINDGAFVGAALMLPPNAPALYDENGNINWQFRADGFHSWTNPLSLIKKTQHLTSGNLVANTSVGYEILPKLQLKANLGYTDFNSDDNVKIPISSRPPAQIATATGQSTFGTNKRTSWIVEPQLNYSRDFNDHHIDIVIGTTFQENNSSYLSIRGTGYSSDALLNSLQAAPAKTVAVDESSQYRYTAFFGRIGYNWKSKYLLNLTGRRDGSSRFGPNNRFGNFGALGAAWVFSKESLIANNLNFLSFGKLRASYGTTGSDQIGDYQFYNTYNMAQGPYQNISLVPTALYNPDYAWELTKKLEAALELGFAEDRIMIEASWYRNRSSNQLVFNPLPWTTGFPFVVGNFDATVENSGWEFLLNTINISSDNIRWRTSINVSIQRNKLLKFDNIESSPYATLYKVGEPLSLQRLYVWEGVDPETGTHQLADINDDGSIDDSDRQLMTPLARQYYGGMVNTIGYKAFELSFLFQFSKGNGYGFMGEMPGTRSQNQPTFVMDRWQKEGDQADVAKFTRSTASSNLYNKVRTSSLNTADASFIRLKTLSLSYTLPASLLTKAGIQESRIYLQGQNLFTLTDFDMVLDPETINALPPLRIIMMGIQFKL